MGQEILPTQPPAQPPPSIENVTFSANEPEWQCKAAEARFDKDFFKKPIHCQKAIMESGGMWLEELSASKTEKNPQRIATKAFQTAGDQPANLAPTQKPQSNESGASGSPASVPNESGMNFEQEEENGNVSFDAEAGVGTQSQPYREDEYSAEFSGQTLSEKEIKKLPDALSNAKRQKHPNLKGIESDFKSRLALKNGSVSCLDKLNELLKGLDSSFSSITSLADKFFLGEYDLYETKKHEPYIKYINPKTKKLDYDRAPSGATTHNGSEMEMTLNKGEINPGFTFIHELFHAAGKHTVFSHEDINKAVRKLENNNEITLNMFIGKYCDKGEFKQK